jgi:hypothetical protein
MSLSEAQELHTVETVVSELPERLRETLGLVHAVDDSIAEITLAALPFGSRVALAGYGIITNKTEAPDEPAEVSLTRFGRNVIAVCALHDVSDEVRSSIEALDEARARRAESREGGGSTLIGMEAQVTL